MKTDETALISPDGNGEFVLADKVLAIMFMEYSVTETNGTLSPRFNTVAKGLGMEQKLLEKWWDERENIQKAYGTGFEALPKIISAKLKMQTLAALNEVSRRGIETFSNKDLISYIKETVHISRLLDDKSNYNLAIGINNGADGHIRIK